MRLVKTSVTDGKRMKEVQDLWRVSMEDKSKFIRHVGQWKMTKVTIKIN